MPPRKPTKSGLSNTAALRAEPSNFWDSSVAPFLEKRWKILLAVVLAIAAGRIVLTYNALSFTFDEPYHFICGLEYLSKHQYRYETQHPPLQRAADALLPYLDGMRTAGKPKVSEEIAALFPPDARTNRTMILMRAGVLPFFLIAAAVVFLWARWRFGAPLGILATAVFSLIPPVLAHAGLATTDIGLTACLGAAFYALVRWAETPTPRRALALGLWTGLSVLAKFTALVYLPAAVALTLIMYLAANRPRLDALGRLVKARAQTLPIAIAVGAFVIWAGFLFSFGPIPAWKSTLRAPAPELFDGIAAVLEHNTEGHRAFLMGQTSTHGWWYFFPVALSVKTPLPVLLLLPLGLVACWKARRTAGFVPIAFALGVLLPAMAGNINIGVRHVLPIYIPMAIVAGMGLAQLARWSRGPAIPVALGGVLLTWLLVSGAARHPDYIAYSNELAGEHPERVLVDSDLDWGQDLKLLSKKLNQLGATEVSLYLWSSESEQELFVKQYGLPRLLPFNERIPNPGWNVVSPTRVGVNEGGFQQGVYPKERYTGIFEDLNPRWYRVFAPTDRVGALMLYNISPSSKPE